MAGTRPLADDAIVFVIDMINDFLVPGEEFVIDEGRTMYPKLRKLLEFARNTSIPIVYAASQGMTESLMEHFWKPIRDRVSLVPGSEGIQVVDELKPEKYSEYEVYLPKWKYSAFHGTKLDVILRNPPFRGRNTIIIAGMATNFCCLCTTIDAFNRDYNVIFVDDLNCTFPSNDGTPAATMHKITVETIKQGYAVEVVDADTLLARLAGKVLVDAA
jgi:nicotinamidase-related amidase